MLTIIIILLIASIGATVITGLIHKNDSMPIGYPEPPKSSGTSGISGVSGISGTSGTKKVGRPKSIK